MSLAANMKKRAEEVLEQRRECAAREVQNREAAATEVQSRIFERAHEVYSTCLYAVREVVERRGDLAVQVELHSGRFDKADFADSLNHWQMAVLALEENGFEARLEFAERAEPHELAGGMATLYTPYIYISWHE